MGEGRELPMLKMGHPGKKNLGPPGRAGCSRLRSRPGERPAAGEGRCCQGEREGKEGGFLGEEGTKES